MTNLQLRIVWLAISTLLLAYASDSYLVTQGGSGIFGVKLIASTRIPVAVFAIPICSVLLAVSSWVGRIYALRTGPTPYERIPVLGFESINLASKEGKVYQGFTLFIFSVLPPLSLIHFWDLFLGAKVAATGNPMKRFDSVWDWSHFGWNDPARICTEFKETGTPPCEGNVTIFPGLEPVVFVLLTVFAIIMLVRFWSAVFRQAAPESTGAKEG
jgi:hypothetical protein